MTNIRQKLQKQVAQLKKLKENNSSEIFQLNKEINLLKENNKSEIIKLKKEYQSLKSNYDSISKEKQKLKAEKKIFEEEILLKTQKMEDNHRYKQNQLKEKYQKPKIELRYIVPSAKSVKIYLECACQDFDCYRIRIYQINPKIEQNREMQFQKNQIFIEQLKPFTEYRFQILVKIKNLNDYKWQSNPQFYFRTLSLQQSMPIDINTQQDKKGNIQQLLQQITKILDFQIDVPQFKISLFGPIGQGKSSLLNTLQSIIKGKYTPVSMVANCNQSVTQRTIIIKNLLSTKVPLSLIDIFGIERSNRILKEENLNPLQTSNYKQIYSHFFNGILYNNYSVNQTLDNQKLIKSQDGFDRLSREIQGVIYVVSYRILQNQEQILRTKHIIKLLRSRGIKPVFALTKCDEFLSNAPISELQTNEQSQNTMKRFLQKFTQVMKEDIFFVSNYLSNTKRDFFKEYFMLKMLQQVLIRAKQRFHRKLQKFFWLQRQDLGYYGVVEEISYENPGSKIEQVLKKSFKNLGIQLNHLLFLESKFNLGKKISKWAKTQEFMKGQLKDFVQETSTKKIIKIKESNNLRINELESLKIPIYDQEKNLQLGIINLGNLTIQQAKQFYELDQQNEFSILKLKKEVPDQDHQVTKLSEVVKQNFLPVKVLSINSNQDNYNNQYIVSFYDFSNNKKILIDQCFIPKKINMKNKEFYNYIRRENPEILDECILYRLQTPKQLAQNDTEISKNLFIKNDEITVNVKKKK